MPGGFAKLSEYPALHYPHFRERTPEVRYCSYGGAHPPHIDFLVNNNGNPLFWLGLTVTDIEDDNDCDEAVSRQYLAAVTGQGISFMARVTLPSHTHPLSICPLRPELTPGVPITDAFMLRGESKVDVSSDSYIEGAVRGI